MPHSATRATHILGNTGKLKLLRRLKDKDTRPVIIIHLERSLARYRGAVDELEDLLELCLVPFAQLHEDIEELEEDVMPGQVRDQDVGSLGVGLVPTEAEAELGVTGR